MIHTMKCLSDIEQGLTQAGLRPTRQRMGLAEILFRDGHRHVTAEQLHHEANATGLPISLATVYNTLHQLTRVGLINHVFVEPGQSYFDTNSAAHHHFYHVESGRLEDIHGDGIEITGLPPAPEGSAVTSIQVVVRLQGTETQR
jgi:Fur family iron response transcriptional regulator